MSLVFLQLIIIPWFVNPPATAAVVSHLFKFQGEKTCGDAGIQFGEFVLHFFGFILSYEAYTTKQN